MTAAPELLTAVRADKWLWAARFFKTRSLAMEAINGGKVHLNGTRIKPARKIAAGDTLVIRKGDFIFEITVTGVALQRRPATEAQALYEESVSSQDARRQLREEQRLLGQSAVRHTPRPDKRARRQIHRFRTSHDD